MKKILGLLLAGLILSAAATQVARASYVRSTAVNVAAWLVTATGSTTARTLPDWFADRANVKAYGALCNGTGNDTPALVAANTAAVSSGTSLLITCRMKINTPAGTITAPLRFEGGGALDFLTAGGSVTLSGTISAPLQQIFYVGVGNGIISFDQANPVVYPQWFGAVANGATDSTDAIHAALNALNSAGTHGNTRTLQLGPGVFILASNGILNYASGVTLRGAGMRATTLKTLTSMTSLFQTSGSFNGKVIEAIEDMTIDANHLAQGIIFGGGSQQRFAVRRCRFINYNTTAIGIQNASHITIEDNEFFEGVAPVSTGISFFGGASDVVIRRNKFEYVNNGIIIDNGASSGDFEQLAEKVVISDNYFDLAWWLIGSSSFTRSGAGVSYTATVLTDTGASFTGLTAGVGNNVRVMPVRRSGTMAAVDGSSLTDSSGSFVTDGVLRGEIVRSGTKYAVVDGIQSGTILRLEGWRDIATADTTIPPNSGGSYTVYKVVLGRVSSFTSTTITTDRWHDLAGNSVTPSAGDLYEVLWPRPNYPINVEQGTRDLIVSRNVVRRGWSDQISTFGNRAQILDNQIEDGQDMGMTVHGDHNLVTGNRVYHQGAGGIYCGCTDSLIANNSVIATTWQNFVNTVTLGGINLDTGSVRNQVIGNFVDGESQPLARYGIVVASTSLATDDNTIALNRMRRHSTADIQVYGATVTNLKLRDNVGTISHANGAVGMDYMLYGTGSPEGAVTAGVGSTFRRTDGAVGTAFYVKATGTGNTGWTTTAPQTSTITLVAGSGTATVVSGSGCTCTDTTANASVKCAVSGTTLTATGTGTDVIRYQCFF